MQNCKQPNLNINLKYLVCSLYTLSEYNPVFKKLVLKNTSYLNKNNKNHFFNNPENFTEFYKFLDSPAVRRFAIILLHPILKKDYPFFSSLKVSFQTLNLEMKSLIQKSYLNFLENN